MNPSFIVDNSVVRSWCFNDEANPYADNVLDSLFQTTALVPSIWPFEVVNVLLASERKKRLEQSDCIRFIDLLSRLPIIVDPEGSGRMMADLLILARKTSLPSYDAAYFDLALRKGFPLATLDTCLQKAAKLSNVEIDGLVKSRHPGENRGPGKA